MHSARPVARFDDMGTGRSMTFSAADELIVAHRPAEVASALERVAAAVARGRWAVGYIAYEAAPGLAPEATVRAPDPGRPLVHMALCGAPEVDAPWPADLGEFHADAWRLDLDADEWARRVAAVRGAIHRGDTYQVNLTTRLRGRVTGDLLAAHRRLVAGQRGAFCAYLDAGSHAILSASPERFVTWRDGHLVATPMKGTAPRSADPVEDARLREALLASPKERAENIMIVDLLRNDLSRVCATGTVRVEDLLRCEMYPTVHQLTSTVACRARASLTLPDMLAALFPCGSITGAPKLSTMSLIAELEDAPRDVYCGAIGVVAPGPTMDASFSVAIRTAVVERSTGTAVYGVGGGITWDSTPEAEYAELCTKARVLEVLGGTVPEARVTARRTP